MSRFHDKFDVRFICSSNRYFMLYNKNNAQNKGRNGRPKTVKKIQNNVNNVIATDFTIYEVDCSKWRCCWVRCRFLCALYIQRTTYWALIIRSWTECVRIWRHWMIEEKNTVPGTLIVYKLKAKRRTFSLLHAWQRGMKHSRDRQFGNWLFTSRGSSNKFICNLWFTLRGCDRA